MSMKKEVGSEDGEWLGMWKEVGFEDRGGAGHEEGGEV